MLNQVEDIPSAIVMRIIATAAELDTLAPTWRSLHDACSDSSVFQSFEWLRSWWRHFGESNPKARLNILVLEQDGLVIAIAPFFIQTLKTFGLFTLRQLSLLGRGVSDYTDLLILPGFEEAACIEIGAYLMESDAFDTMMFTDVPDGSPLRKWLNERLRRTGWYGHSGIHEQCPRTPLMGSWTRTLETFDDNHRKRVAYLDRKLRKNFKVEVRRIPASEDAAPALTEFMTMHQRRWTRAGEPGAFASEATQRFHHEAARQLHERGWLALSFLILNDRAVAANYAFKCGGRLQFYLSGIGEDDSARKFAPGILLHVYSMQAMIDEGVRTYDFLRGTERYKYELGAKDVPNWRLVFVRPSLIVRVKHRLRRAQNSLGAWLKYHRARLRSRKG